MGSAQRPERKQSRHRTVDAQPIQQPTGAQRAPGSSSWLTTVASGNRGFVVEIVAARSAVLSGIRFLDGTPTLLVRKENVVGFGKRILTSLGETVEGDVVETLVGGGERFIDVKGISGSFDVDQLRRVGDAVADERVEEFIFAVEEGATIPSAWLTALAEINLRLAAANLRPIRYGVVSGF